MTLHEQLRRELYQIFGNNGGWDELSAPTQARWDRRTQLLEIRFPLIGAAEDMRDALAAIIPRFEKCMIASGTDPEFAAEATKMQRAALAKATPK